MPTQNEDIYALRQEVETWKNLCCELARRFDALHRRVEETAQLVDTHEQYLHKTLITDTTIHARAAREFPELYGDLHAISRIIGPSNDPRRNRLDRRG